MRLGEKEFQLKSKFTLRQEKAISVALSKLAEGVLRWLQDANASEKELEPLNVEWQSIGAMLYQKVDGLPSVDDIGSDGLMAVTQDFFSRGSAQKK